MRDCFEATISGSFKFKPEIDELIEEFADHSVVVLEPTKGWLYIPGPRLYIAGFRPLPNERDLTIQQVENRFLTAVRASDFLYVNNPENYVGLSMSFEIGFAHGLGKPIFVREPLQPGNFDYDLASYHYWCEAVTVATPAEAARIVAEARQ